MISCYPFRIRIRPKRKTRAPAWDPVGDEVNSRSLEHYINEKIASGFRGKLTYYEIAKEAKICRDDVSRLLYYVDCSSSCIVIDDSIRGPSRGAQSA